MIKTKIPWADSTWNPVTGCYHGCEYCYANRIAQRFGTGWRSATDNGIHELDEPMRGQRIARNGTKKTVEEAYPYDFQPTFYRYRLDQPKKWTTPRTIFVCRMADLFGDRVPDEWIDEVFEACRKAPQHRYLFLTKNPKRYTDYGVPRDRNKWYGTTITSLADIENADHLPAFSNTFYSIEPIMGDLCSKEMCAFMNYPIGWYIIGAESGNRKGKTIPEREWIEKICKAADIRAVPVFMKDSLIPIVGEENMRREFPWSE